MLQLTLNPGLTLTGFRTSRPWPKNSGACAGPDIILDVRLQTKYANKQEVVIRTEIAVLNFRMTLGLAIVSRDLSCHHF